MGALLARYKRMPLPAKAALWFTLCSIIQRGISVLSIPIFTRLMSTSQFGEYNLYLTWCFVLSIVVTLNINAEVFNKGLADHEEDRDSFTTNQIGLVTLLFASFLLLYFLFQEQVNQVTGLSFFLVTSAFLEVYFGAIVNFWYARKRYDYGYRPLVLVTVAIALSSVVIGFFGVYYAPEEYKVYARVIANILPVAIVALILGAGFISKSAQLFSKKCWAGTIALSLPLLPHYLSQMLLNQADKVMIGWYVDSSAVALYSLAHSAGLILVLINNGINSSFVPWSYSKLKADKNACFGKTTNMLMLLVVAVNGLLMLLAPEAVKLLATADYYDAIYCIAPIATSVVFCFAYALFVNIEIYYGKPQYVATASIFAALINLALNFILIPRFGYIAAAYTTAGSYFCTMILHYCFMKKTLSSVGRDTNPYDFRFMLACCISSVCICFIAIASYGNTLLRIAILAALVIACVAFKGKIANAIKTLKA